MLNREMQTVTNLIEAFASFVRPCFGKIALEGTRYQSSDSPDSDEAPDGDDGRAMTGQRSERKEQGESRHLGTSQGCDVEQVGGVASLLELDVVGG